MAQDGIVWIDGVRSDFAGATVALEDRGFMFGDGVYEVIRAYDARPFALEEHLARLASSAAGIELELPLARPELRDLVLGLLAESGSGDAEIYLQVTRGTARRHHLFPVGVPPTLVVGVRPLRPLDPALRERGCTVVTLPDERWARCDLKTICLLPNVLAKERAHRAGAFEALLVRDGIVTEGSSSNVFFSMGGRLVTPRRDRRILPGITRARVLELARERHLQVEERDIRIEEVRHAQEAFLSSTMLELMPIVAIDGETIGAGKPGPVWRTLHTAFLASIGPC